MELSECLKRAVKLFRMFGVALHVYFLSCYSRNAFVSQVLHLLASPLHYFTTPLMSIFTNVKFGLAYWDDV